MEKKELTEDQKKELLYNMPRAKYTNINIVKVRTNKHYIDSFSNEKRNDIASLSKSNFAKHPIKAKNNMKVKRR